MTKAGATLRRSGCVAQDVISLPEHDQQAPEDVGGFAQRCGLELLRFAYLLCGDRHRAEDLMQDVLLAMYRRFPDLLTLDNPVGYARFAGVWWTGSSTAPLPPLRC